MDHLDTTRRRGPTPADVRARFLPLVGAIVFLLAFVAVALAGPLLTEDTLPLPGSPDAEVFAYVRRNGDVLLVTGLLQATSALGLALFTAAVTRRLADARVGHLRQIGAGAVVALQRSAVTSAVTAASARSAGPSTVAALQQVTFVLGGVVHVVLLGVLVWLASRDRTWSRPVRVLGAIAAVPAVLSVLSVPLFAASVLLPLGRVLCMVWTVTAGVSALRGRSLRPRPEATEG